MVLLPAQTKRAYSTDNYRKSLFSPRASRSMSAKVVVVVHVLVTHYKFVRICTTKYYRWHIFKVLVSNLNY